MSDRQDGVAFTYITGDQTAGRSEELASHNNYRPSEALLAIKMKGAVMVLETAFASRHNPEGRVVRLQ